MDELQKPPLGLFFDDVYYLVSSEVFARYWYHFITSYSILNS
jgi:hypothetical protein